MTAFQNMSREESAREVVATNQMAIVNVQALKGKATVKRVTVGHPAAIPQYGHWWKWQWDVGRQVAC